MIKKHKHFSNITMMKATVTFGYILFALWILATIVGTIIPWSSLLFSPSVRHLNVLTVMLSFTAASIAPPLVAYILADTATRGKNRLLHHYNGVLLGISSFLLVLLFTLLNTWLVSPFDQLFDDSLSSIVLALTPPLLAIVVMVGLVVQYAITQKTRQHSLLEHTPYQVLLMGSVLGSIAYYLSLQLYTVDTIPVIALMYIAIPAGLTAIAYSALAHQRARFTGAVLAMSLLFITIIVIGQLVSTILVSLLAVCVVSIAAWAYYLYTIRSSRGN